MTEEEEIKFKEIVKLFPEHHYEVLGLKPFSEYNKQNFQERYDYAKKDFTKDEITKAHDLIAKAQGILVSKREKYIYDTDLKRRFERKLNEIIKNFVTKDKIFNNDEREVVEEKGNEYGFTIIEINSLIEAQRKIYNFTDDSTNSKQKEAASTTTATGSPKLEIHNNHAFAKNNEFIFDNIKLTETRREIITIKNGGGGTLDATAVFSKKWIEVVPKNIHQSNLPQDVTIIINPSKDPSLKNGIATQDTINLTYASSGGTIRVPILIKMAVEGHYALVKRLAKQATLVSILIATITLLYFFSRYNYSGWVIFGFVISAITLGLGISAAVQNEKRMINLIPGAIILLITSRSIFLLFLSVILTWYASKLIFKTNPFRKEFIAAIPMGSFILFLILFSGFNTLQSSNNFHETIKTTQTQTTLPTPSKSNNKSVTINNTGSFDNVPKNSETINKAYFIGNWNIENENSSYYFNSNGTGKYKNSRGRNSSFKWSLTGSNIKIVMSNDGSIWLWQVNSYSSNRIEMYNSSQNIKRIIIK